MWKTMIKFLLADMWKPIFTHCVLYARKNWEENVLIEKDWKFQLSWERSHLELTWTLFQDTISQHFCPWYLPQFLLFFPSYKKASSDDLLGWRPNVFCSIAHFFQDNLQIDWQKLYQKTFEKMGITEIWR